MKLLCFFLFLFASAACGEGTWPKYKSPNNCGLECWLENLVINVPTITTIVSEVVNVNITISQLQCKGIEIGTINSTFAPPTSLDLLLGGVSVQCGGIWFAQEISLWPYPSFSGNFFVQLNQTSVLLGLDLIKGSDGLASAANATKCRTVIQPTNITFFGDGPIIDWGLDTLVSYMNKTIQQQLDAFVCQQMTALVNTNLTLALQEVDAKIRPFLTPSNPSPAPPVPSSGIIVLTQDPVIRMAGHLVSILFSRHGQMSFNVLVDHFTNGTGSVTLTPQQLSSFVITTPVVISNMSLGNLTFGLTAFSASGLDTWGDVELVPTSNYTVNFHSEMDTLNLNLTFFVNVSIGGDIVISETLYEEGNLVVQLANNNMNVSLQLAIIDAVFNSLQAIQFTDVGCVLSSLYNVNLTELYFNMSATQLAIFALGGSVEQDLDALIDNVLSLFTSSFDAAIPAFFNSFVATVIQQKANQFFAQELALNTTCQPAAPPPATFNQNSTVYAASGAAGACVVVAFILFIRRKQIKKDDFDDPETEPLVASTDYEPCLALHHKIPFTVRFGIPILLFINVVLFISSNTSVGASVYVLLTAGDKHWATPALFNFSLANSVHDMWNAGVYPLSILIGTFSGAWPYMKLLIMLMCWFVPVSALAVKKREYLLMALDMLGKWSLIDSFVLTLMLVAFQFHVASTPVPGTNPPEIGIADVYVTPHWGFYSFLLATMMSLILSHIILALHHHATDNKTWDTSAEEKIALWRYAFKDSALKRFLIVFLLLACIGLICYGSAINSFAFDFRGAAGLLLVLVGESNQQSYSLFTLGTAVPGSTPNPNDFGIRWIEATYFTFTIAVPLAHLVVLLFLWVTPLKYSTQRKVFVVTEILNAWSALEVFVVAIIAAILEIRQFAQFVVGDKCDPINVILKEYFDKELKGDTKCFDVIATLEQGCWILFAACIIYFGVASFVMRKCHNAIKEYNKPAQHNSSGQLIN